MLKLRYMISHRGNSGFALPTIVIASLILMMVLMAALSTTTSTRTALEEQYYSQLAREAAEAGWVKAEACLNQTGTAQWAGSGKSLRPETDCYGNTAITCPSANAACYVGVNGNIRTSFNIGAPSVGDYGKTSYTVNSITELTRTGSPTTVWKSVNASINYTTANVKTPRISGGAGWDANDHLGLVVTSDNQLYGFGANGAGQLNDAKLPTLISTPIKITLPASVQTVKKVSTSGTGASITCIIGDNDKAYCRGSGFGLATGMWHEVMIPGGLPVREMSINGYGGDNACFLAGATSISTQAYCFGTNYFSELGNGSNVSAPITAPVRFVIPNGLYAKSVEIQGVNSCVIASDDEAYCAGRADDGQLMGTDDCYGCVYLPVKLDIPRLGTVDRTVKSIIMPYHLDEDVYGGSIFALSNDGFIWAGGQRINGTHGTGTTSGATGTSQPDLYGYNEGGGFRSTGWEISVASNSSLCLDIPGADFSDGNSVELYGCNGTEAQRFSLTDAGKVIVMTDTIAYPPGDGYNKCIDIPDGNFTDGIDVQVYTCNATDAQQWRWDAATKSIINVASGKCLDIETTIASGSDLQIWTCNGTNAQKFNVDGRSMPWKGMIASMSSFCGVRSDHTSGVWCSGKNNKGQLGNVVNASLGTDAHGVACTDYSTSVNFSTGDKVNRKIDLSKLSSEWKYQWFATQIIATDGNVYGAGENTYGKLGFGSSGSTQCTTIRMSLPNGVKALDMSTRDQYTTYVLGSDGNVYAVGRNNVGQVGDGTTTDRNIPAVVRMPRTGAAY